MYISLNQNSHGSMVEMQYQSQGIFSTYKIKANLDKFDQEGCHYKSEICFSW